MVQQQTFTFEKALFYFIKNDDKRDIQCYMNIANIYFDEEFYQVSLTNYYFAKDILEEINIDDPDTYKELYSKISKCYMKLNDSEKSLEFIEKDR